MSNPNFSYIDTELSAINTILGTIGQAPIQKIDLENPEVNLIYNLLQEAIIDVLGEGWAFNKEDHITLTPDSDGFITVPANALHYDISDGQRLRSKDVTIRNGRLYDKVDHTDIFTGDVDIDVVWLFGFDLDLANKSEVGGSIPQVFKRYITAKASTRAATQLLTNSELTRILASQEAISRSVCMEYECNQGDDSYFGLKHNTSYDSYQPYKALSRI